MRTCCAAIAWAALASCRVSTVFAQDLQDATLAAAQDLQDATLAAPTEGGVCECSCCHVSYRPPSMQVNGVNVMCTAGASVNDTQSDCPSQCTTSTEGESLITTAKGVVDYGRFCFLSCQPPEARTIGESCHDLHQNHVEEGQTSGGNGADWASQQTPVVGDGAVPEQAVDEAPQFSDEAAIEEAKAPAAAESSPEDKDTGAMVAEAQGNHALAAGLEARLSESEAKSMRLLAASTDALRKVKAQATNIHGSSAVVKSMEVQAAIYARSAATSARKAQAEFDELKAATREAGMEAGKAAAAEMQQEADTETAEALGLRTKFAPLKMEPLAEAAKRAAKPYDDALQRAVAMRAAYTTQAHQLNDLAGQLQQNARTLASQAAIYQTAGNTDVASQMVSNAKNMLGDAATTDAEAHKWQGVAQQISESLPQYQLGAAMAAARAAAIANPAGQPPPPPAPLLLQRGLRTK